jgi:hypothetical protein
MSELSSCYFCGTALDAPVERYPLTPPTVDADTGRSVALCPTCRRKLVKVLEVVAGEFGAVSEAAETDAAATAGTADSDPSATPEAGAANDATAGDADRADAATGDAATESGDDEGETVATEASDDEGETVATEASDDEGAEESETDDGSARVEAAESGQAGDAAGESSETPGTDTDEAPGQAAGDGGAAVGEDATTESAAGESADSEPTAGESAGGQATAEESASSGGGKPDLLSTPAAQQVIKLLQNREFPLDREEFEVVASNAYEIPMGDCRDVIDTLVAEEYVAEDGDQLVRPE